MARKRFTSEPLKYTFPNQESYTGYGEKKEHGELQNAWQLENIGCI